MAYNDALCWQAQEMRLPTGLPHRSASALHPAVPQLPQLALPGLTHHLLLSAKTAVEDAAARGSTRHADAAEQMQLCN